MRKLFGNKSIWILAILIIIVAGIVGELWNRSNSSGKGYSIVYLTSGEIYVGHFYTFPTPTLEGAYILQNVKSVSDQTKGQTKTDLQLFPLAEAAWSPTKLYVSWEHIIYYGPLDENSVAAKGIRSKTQ